MNRTDWHRAGEAAYVAATGCLGLLGAVHASPAWTLAAVALTLPCGVGALVLMYGGYALISGTGGIWAPTTRAGGDEATWLAEGSASFNVTMLILAAVGNVVLFELLARRRTRA